MESVPGRSTDEHFLFTNKELMNIFINCDGRTYDDKYNNLKKHIKETLTCTEEQDKTNIKILSNFKHQFLMRWDKVKRCADRMEIYHSEWLNKSVPFPVTKESVSKLGRPVLDFKDSSERTKRRKTSSLRSQVPVEELVHATHMSLRASGKPIVASVLKEIISLPPDKVKSCKKLLEGSKEHKSKMLTPEKALSIFVEAKLTRKQYEMIRLPVKDTYPSYKIIQEAKKACYPDCISITENSAEVPLQKLLDHTTKRILFMQTDVLLTLNPEQCRNMTLICKWGCDGSAGHSEYKQKFVREESEDAYMFLSSIVPLQILIGSPDSSNAIIVWSNPRPSSPRFCRPIRLKQIHETQETTLCEMKNIEREIETLNSTTYSLNDQLIEVSHTLLFTMTDGKVCNAVTETLSAMKCYICGATSKEFNDLNKMLIRPVNSETLQFGLSPLHAWIRFFECLIHLSYKLEIKKWQARSEEEKKSVRERKENLLKLFRNEMGLIVDKPKPGYGNTNDGNTARKFFKNPALSARITGIDQQIIQQFRVVLETLSSGYKINVKKFSEYCVKTAQLYVSLYPWYNMPTTVHKVLIHGPIVVSQALLPIGQLSEEAQEAKNKDIKKYREGFSRKLSREKTMTDVFNSLLISSDPVISSARTLPRKAKTSLDKDTLTLVEEPTIPKVVENFDVRISESSDEDSED